MFIVTIVGALVMLLFLCKVVTLIIIRIKKNTPNDFWCIVKKSMVDCTNGEGYCYLIPTVMWYIGHKSSSKYLCISVRFLTWEYYTSYELSNEI